MTTGMPKVPYLGLTPYTEVDAQAFFGRDREIHSVTNSLLAQRLLIMYGPSGAGKTSLLRAGVARLLEQEIGPKAAVVLFSTWQGDPVAGLLRAVRDELARRFDQPDGALIESPHDLADTLERWAGNLDVELVIILDQFEQYFLYHEGESGSGTFADEFPRAARRNTLRASFLICLREDWLFKLDRWQYSIPRLFDSLRRIDYLDRDAAREAIVRPLDMLGARAAPDFVEAVLASIENTSAARDDARISPVHLQIVMAAVWDAEQREGSTVMSLETLNRLGGPSQIIENQMTRLIERLTPRQRMNLARISRFLVTPSGARLALTAEDIGMYADVAVSDLMEVLDILTQAQARVLRSFVLRDDPNRQFYELSHDILVPALSAWSAKYAPQQKRKIRKVQALLLAIAFGGAIAFGFWIGRFVCTGALE